MEFIRKLMNRKPKNTDPPARGAAPVQSQEEQDATRVRMESEMADQREQREARNRE